MVPIFKIKIENGIIKDLDDKTFNDYLFTLNGNCEMIVKKEEKNRSNKQNRLYWGYLRIISQETGNSENNLNEYFKRVHLPPVFIAVMGKEIKIPATTTTLSTKEFKDYLEAICAECGVPIPDESAIYLTE